jgi:putative ABC transport system permease protein
MSVIGGTGAPADLRVVGIVERGLPGRTGETAFVGWPDATGRLGVLGADAFVVRFAPGQADRARPALEATARGLALEPNTLAEVEGAISSALGRVFGLFDALALVAVLMAGLGIVNTLTMNVIERVREIGILRATGMTRRQVARMVVVEAGVLGVVGAIVGGVVGVAASAAMVALASGGLPIGFQVPWTTLAGAALFGIVVAMVAAYQPARLASRVSIVRAVQFE